MSVVGFQFTGNSTVFQQPVQVNDKITGPSFQFSLQMVSNAESVCVSWHDDEQQSMKYPNLKIRTNQLATNPT